MESVSKAFNKGYEVAIIVYKIKNSFDLTQRYGNRETEKMIQRLKKAFSKLIERELRTDDMILLIIILVKVFP
jgi:hypothetical protein